MPAPSSSGVLKHVLGGWRLASIAILQSGLPFTVHTTAPFPTGDFNADGFNWDTPNTPAFGHSLATSRSNFISGLFKTSDFPRRAASPGIWAATPSSGVFRFPNTAISVCRLDRPDHRGILRVQLRRESPQRD